MAALQQHPWAVSRLPPAIRSAPGAQQGYSDRLSSQCNWWTETVIATHWDSRSSVRLSLTLVMCVWLCTQKQLAAQCNLTQPLERHLAGCYDLRNHYLTTHGGEKIIRGSAQACDGK